jgi:glyoxylase-like metal-dependent hydrolase (beta-lactamase superfamily II)
LAVDGVPGLHAIDVEYVRPGLASSHLLIDSGRAAFIDVGTTHSVPRLLKALAEQGIAPADVDFVLLTHVHLDHAGGAGALMRELPNARCIVHPRGARHMIDPELLIAGAQAVYGDEKFAELYGEIPGIAAERVVSMEDGGKLRFGGRELEFIHTPGHALHHYCIVDRTASVIFAGDTFGISYRDFDTAHGAFIFPTTTPVQFDPPALKASVAKLMSYQPRTMILTHYSAVRELDRLSKDLCAAIDAFVAIAHRHANAPERNARIAQDMFAWLSAQLDAHGYRGDLAERHRLLDGDVVLNTQGVEVWLDKSKRSH